MKTKWPLSDHYGLRSPVIQTQFQTKSATSVVEFVLFVIPSWCGVFDYTLAYPRVLLLLLLLMCYSSGNLETAQRLGIGNVTDHPLWRMANGEHDMNMSLYIY